MTADVIVIGAGPVGVTAALTLAKQALDVCLLERGDGPSRESHASTFHPPTLELLSELGVAEALLDRGRVVRRLQYRDREYGKLAEFDYAAIESETRFPFRLQAEQRELTSLAYDHLRNLSNVEVQFNVPVETVRDTGDGAVVSTPSGEYHARWVIAADGAHSAVRRALGVGFTGATYELRYLTVMTTADLARLIPGIALVTYISGGPDGVGLLTLPDHWRVCFRVSPDEDEADALAPERLQARLRNAISSDVDRYPIVDRFIYFVHRRVAETFRVGRVLLAGDAAHVNSPSGGMGMNSGIHDAYVFGRTLGQIMAGAADEALLDARAAERRRVAIEIIGARSEQNYLDIVETDPLVRNARRRRLAAIEADTVATREYLVRSSMLDHAPRPGAYMSGRAL